MGESPVDTDDCRLKPFWIRHQIDKFKYIKCVLRKGYKSPPPTSSHTI